MLAVERTVILSTHIVEDISQTCRNLAVLTHGQLLFCGSPAELMRSAAGHVWTLTSPDIESHDHDLTVVSMLHLAEGIQYRLVGPSITGYPFAQEAQPELEDGYIWLMKSRNQPVGGQGQ
jgi:ABC-2 type transport system ATP-binding protein